MTIAIPKYIEERIRRATPADSHVVPGSTPVVSFGNASIATVATLGLNPSRVEFYRNGHELVGESRRLATHRSLGTSDLTVAPPDAVAQVLDDCNTYFLRNLYRRWFDQLEQVLDACGASYYDGSACHLDLVQWATDPTWGKLRPATVRRALLAADAPFLIRQLQNENIRVLLVNGNAVMRQLQRIGNFELQEVDGIIGFAHQDTRMFVGRMFDRVRVIGWSTNIQSSFGVTTELRDELAERVEELANETLVA